MKTWLIPARPGMRVGMISRGLGRVLCSIVECGVVGQSFPMQAGPLQRKSF